MQAFIIGGLMNVNLLKQIPWISYYTFSSTLLLNNAYSEELKKIYKEEHSVWLNSETEYGCEVVGTSDMISFGFDSNFLPGINIAYWKYAPDQKKFCGDFHCPPQFILHWKKSFYKSDFEQQSVNFNGMSLELKWHQKNEAYLGHIRFLEKEPSTLLYEIKGKRNDKQLKCVSGDDETQKLIKTVSVVKNWKENLCSEKKRKNNPRLSGPNQIGNGGSLGMSESAGGSKIYEHDN